MSLSAKILCSTCGREILPPDAPPSDHGRCICKPEEAQASAVEETGAVEQSRKSCYVCGADLAGQRRYKDRNGKYWCSKCRASDAQQKTAVKIYCCVDCGRSVDPAKLTDFRDIKLCSSCLAERTRKLGLHAKKRYIQKSFKREEWGTILKLVVAAIVLGALAIFGWMNRG